MSESTQKMEALQRHLIMALTPAQRLRMAGGMFQAAKSLAAAGIRADAASRGECVDMRRELFLRLYGNDFDEGKKKEILLALSSG